LATPEEVRAIAQGLMSVADDPDRWAVSRLRDRRTFASAYPFEFITTRAGDVVVLRRRGRGLIVEINVHTRRPKVRKTLTPDLARDLARLLRKACS
jgi:hypothetical protein